jgi:hypothetical protein
MAAAINAVGNIAISPLTPLNRKCTGGVLPVEAGEAKWNLDVLGALFDSYFVPPAKLRQRKDALSQKLRNANG